MQNLQNWADSRLGDINNDMLLDMGKGIGLFNDEEEATAARETPEQRLSGNSELVADYLGLEDPSLAAAGQGGRQAEQGQGATGGVGKKREQKRSQG